MSARTDKMAKALRAARRVLAAERQVQFECCTIPPMRSYDQMDAHEKRAIQRFDRMLAKIDKAIR